MIAVANLAQQVSKETPEWRVSAAQQNFAESSIMGSSHSQRGEVIVGTDSGIGRPATIPDRVAQQ
jgi:hypothetical protein